MVFSSFIQPFIMEPPCSPVYMYRETASHNSEQNGIFGPPATVSGLPFVLVSVFKPQCQKSSLSPSRKKQTRRRRCSKDKHPTADSSNAHSAARDTAFCLLPSILPCVSLFYLSEYVIRKTRSSQSFAVIDYVVAVVPQLVELIKLTRFVMKICTTTLR